MRVAIVGPGAVGSMIGGYLTLGGLEVVFVGRPGKRVENLQRDGLRIQGVRGSHTSPLRVVTDAKQAGEVDVAIVTVKAYDTAQAVRQHRVLFGERTTAISLQNGIGNAETLAEVLDPTQVMAATTTMGGYLDSAGVLHHAGEGETFIGDWQGGFSARLTRVAEAFTQAGVLFKPVDDVRSILFSKLAVNCGINPFTALLRLKNGALLDRPDLLVVCDAAVREVSAVAQAEGMALDADSLVARTREVMRLTAENHSSMYQDVTARRRTEIDAICGAVARLGERNGVPTPVNRTLAALVNALPGQADSALKGGVA